MLNELTYKAWHVAKAYLKLYNNKCTGIHPETGKVYLDNKSTENLDMKDYYKCSQSAIWWHDNECYKSVAVDSFYVPYYSNKEYGHQMMTQVYAHHELALKLCGK